MKRRRQLDNNKRTTICNLKIVILQYNRAFSYKLNCQISVTWIVYLTIQLVSESVINNVLHSAHTIS